MRLKRNAERCCTAADADAADADAADDASALPVSPHLFSAASLRLLDAENCWEDLCTLHFCKQPRFCAGILGEVRVDDIPDNNRLVIVKDCKSLLLL